jgi:Transglycosylase SLT domain/SPOR domain
MKSGSRAAIFSICLAFAAAANAQFAQSDSASEPQHRAENPPPPSHTGQEAPPADNSTAPTNNPPSICQLLESAAAANGLPFEFFAQVIWRESRFRADVVGPITRTGQRAQGIAQFMPSTAAERLLHDPFDPVQALPKSAEFLRELRAQFGNLGLAAAAYNAGPRRIRDWLAGKRTLPLETQMYVRNVTGRSAQEWSRPDQKSLMVTIPHEMPCAQTAKTVTKPQSPSTVVQVKPKSNWGVQLVGDRSEIKALAAYRQLRKKHEAILGSYEPILIRTIVGVSTAPIWNRVRIEADSRETAQTLCLRLKAVGENCLVQHN